MDTDSTAPTGVEADTDADETAAAVAATEESQTDENQTDDEAEGQDDGGEEAEEIEFDFGGNKLKVPKGAIPEEIASQLDKFTKGTWSDYTRKSQEVAERTKSIEAREGVVEKLSTMSGELLQTFSRGLALKDELSQLQNIDLSRLWQSEPDQARRVSDAISQKQAELSRIANTVSSKEQELNKAQQSEVARRMDEGKQVLERKIKGFSEKAKDVVAYAVKCGIPETEAHTWPLNPIVTEAFHKAMLYDRMQAAAKPKPAPTQAPSEPVKPLKARGAASASKDPDKMSPDEWLVWRNNQLRKQGRA